MGSRDDSPGFGITGLRGECVPFIGFLATMAVMTTVAHVLGSERLHGRDGRVEIPIWEMRGIGNTGFGNSSCGVVIRYPVVSWRIIPDSGIIHPCY